MGAMMRRSSIPSIWWVVSAAAAVLSVASCDGNRSLDGGEDASASAPEDGAVSDGASDARNGNEPGRDADELSVLDAVTSDRSSGDGADGDGSASDQSVRFRLSIQPDAIDAELTEFPVLVHLAEDSGRNGVDTSALVEAAASPEQRANLSFVQEQREKPLFAEVDTWDVDDGEAWIWVKIPSVSANSETSFSLVYDPQGDGNDAHIGGVGSEAGREVWSNGFVGVYHFGERGDGSTGEFRDSTANRIHATGGAGSPSATPGTTSGKIGNAPKFDGEDDFIEIPDHDGFSQPTTGALTISLWVARDSLTYPGRDYIRYVGKGIAGEEGENGPNNHEWTFNMYDDDLEPFPSRRQRRSFYICDYESGQCAGDYAQPEWEPYGPIPYVSEGEWIHYTGRVDDREIYAYNNGILGHDPVDYRNYSDNNIAPNNEDAPVRIGTRDRPSSSGILHGKIDEFRVSGRFRSEAWIRANYATQRDELLTYQRQPPP